MLLDIYPKQKLNDLKNIKLQIIRLGYIPKNRVIGEPADALRFDAAEPLHPLRHCEASYGKAHRS